MIGAARPRPPVARVSGGARSSWQCVRRSSSTGPAWRSAARSQVRSACAPPPFGGPAVGGVQAAPDRQRPGVRPPAHLPDAGRARQSLGRHQIPSSHRPAVPRPFCSATGIRPSPACNRPGTRPGLVCRFGVGLPAGIEPAIPSLPSMRGWFTPPHSTLRSHTTVQLRGVANG